MLRILLTIVLPVALPLLLYFGYVSMMRRRAQALGEDYLPGWADVPLADTLEERLGSPVYLENDANAAALAEWRFGAGRGFASAVYLKKT